MIRNLNGKLSNSTSTNATATEERRGGAGDKYIKCEMSFSKGRSNNIQSHGCFALYVDDVFHSLSSGFMCLSRGLILIKLRSY